MFLNEPFGSITSEDSRGKEDAAQENEESTHEAEVQRRSQFISEVIGERKGATSEQSCSVFSHVST